MTGIMVGYARRSTHGQDLTARRAGLERLGVAPDRVYTDHGLTGTDRARPGLDRAIAAVGEGDTLVVARLDRLARSVPDARDIADRLRARGVRLAPGATVHDPDDLMGRMSFNVLATFAEFEADLVRPRTREGMAIARAKGSRRETAEAVRKTAKGARPQARHRGIHRQRPRGGIRRLQAHRLQDARARHGHVGRAVMALTTRYGIDVTAYDEEWHGGNVRASLPSADYFSEDEAVAVAEDWAETLDRCRVRVIEM